MTKFLYSSNNLSIVYHQRVHHNLYLWYDTTSNPVALKLDLSLVCLSGVKLHAHKGAKTPLKSHFNFKQSQEMLQLWLISLVQLIEYETSSYFLHIFQINTAVCLIIYMFCKICERKCEPEIVLFL